MYCVKCGKKLEEGLKFCDNCGTEIKNNIEHIEKEKNNIKTSVVGKINPQYATVILSIVSLILIFQKWIKFSAYRYESVKYSVFSFINVAYTSNTYFNSACYVLLILEEIALIASIITALICIVLYLFKVVKKDEHSNKWGMRGAFAVMFMVASTIIVFAVINVVDGISCGLIYRNDCIPTIFVYLAAISSAVSLKIFYKNKG